MCKHDWPELHVATCKRVSISLTSLHLISSDLISSELNGCELVWSDPVHHGWNQSECSRSHIPCKSWRWIQCEPCDMAKTGHRPRSLPKYAYCILISCNHGKLDRFTATYFRWSEVRWVIWTLLCIFKCWVCWPQPTALNFTHLCFCLAVGMYVYKLLTLAESLHSTTTTTTTTTTFSSCLTNLFHNYCRLGLVLTDIHRG